MFSIGIRYPEIPFLGISSWDALTFFSKETYKKAAHYSSL